MSIHRQLDQLITQVEKKIQPKKKIDLGVFKTVPNQDVKIEEVQPPQLPDVAVEAAGPEAVLDEAIKETKIE